MKTRSIILSLILALALVTLGAPSLDAAEASRVAHLETASNGLSLAPQSDGGLVITVTGPNDYTLRQETDGAAFVDTSGLADGYYRYEVRALPNLDAATRAALARARATGDTAIVERLRAEGKLPTGNDVMSGGFTVYAGAIVDPNLVETGAASGGVRAATDEALSNVVAEDQVILDDLIVDGSACIGQDCVNGESFGFDTLRLKENNLRIKFQDTSNSASFPTNDWQITANDSSNGGAEKFSIDDIDGGRTPFTIEAGAPSNSLYVDDGGRLGFGTATPVVNLHVVEGNTPTLRLEQDGSDGFTPQTWDVAGNEANFFVRDATNGSKLPFKIIPGAATNSLYIANDGDIGIRDTSPDARFDVDTNDANAQPAIRALSTASSGAQDMLTLEVSNDNNLRTNFGSTGGVVWNWRQTYRQNQYNLELDGGDEFTLDSSGNVTIQGTLTEMSDRDAKENFADVEPNSILERLAQLPVQRWNYIEDEDDVQHIGVMAQDFHAAFGLGANERGISAVDRDGVAFAAIQALYSRLLEKEAVIDELRERLEKLEAMEP